MPKALRTLFCAIWTLLDWFAIQCNTRRIDCKLIPLVPLGESNDNSHLETAQDTGLYIYINTMSVLILAPLFSLLQASKGLFTLHQCSKNMTLRTSYRIQPSDPLTFHTESPEKNKTKNGGMSSLAIFAIIIVLSAEYIPKKNHWPWYLEAMSFLYQLRLHPRTRSLEFMSLIGCERSRYPHSIL